MLYGLVILAVDRGYLREIDLNELERMCGQHLSQILTNFSIVQSQTWEEGMETYTLYTGFVKGMYGSTQTIIALTDTGKVWCAGIDPEKNVLRYFHNSPEESWPAFMQGMMEACAGMDIVVNDPGSGRLTVGKGKEKGQ